MRKEPINFDERIDRTNTNSIKYDFVLQRGKPEGILPLWVADMDFQAPKPVLDALKDRVEHGIFGYSEGKEEYFLAVRDWMERRHGWIVKRNWLVKTPGIVFALAMAVKAYTKPGDSVMIQPPVYYPFREVIEDNERIVVENTLLLGEDGSYHMDLNDFEQKARENRVRLFFLCNPHNPVGRVWTREELKALGELCKRLDILVVSDEIHQDFVFKGKHTVFASIDEELKERTITCTAPSKTFNIAGLQISNIFISNPELKRSFKKEISAAGYSQLNTLGLTACEAAYRYGEEWHDQLMDYLKENIQFVRSYLEDHLPELKLIEPDGTYLLWLDFNGLGLNEDEREELIVKKAGLWLDSGAMFGPVGEGFERINIACPRSVLKEAFDKLRAALEKN